MISYEFIVEFILGSFPGVSSTGYSTLGVFLEKQGVSVFASFAAPFMCDAWL